MCSDGTAAGTRAVTDFVPSQPFDGRDWMKPAGNRVWFVADDVVHGEEIWVSDGTPQGTRRATDFGYDVPFSTRSSSMEEVNGRLVFMANDGIHPTRLWTTTGTPESVVSLPVEFEYYEPDLKKSEGRLFFQLTALEHGGELWTTDGTVAGTRLVTDLCPGSCTSLNYSDQVLPWPGGVLLMGAHDGVHGREIWLSDGTRAGTRRITEFEDFSAVQDSQFAPPVSFAGRIWFATESFFEEGGLWSTDGDPASTRLVAHLGRSEPTSQPRYLTAAAGGRLYFAAHDGTVDGLWSTLGPPETTVLVKTATSQPSAAGDIQNVAAVGSLVFFWERAYLPFGPQEQLWRTDGTAAGTFMLSNEEELANEGVGFKGKLYVPAWTELWASDGTVAGTGPFFTHPGGVGKLSVAGGALYFSAGNNELWRSDGTLPGTQKLATIPSLGFAERFVASGALVFFNVGNQIWKTDGTPGGTSQVAITGFDPSDLTPFGGGIAFLANSVNDRALFVSDGTAAGTVLVKAFRKEDRNFKTPSSLTAFAGRLYLSADDGVHGAELWTSDGTAVGTVMARDIAPGWRSSFPRRLTVAGGRLFFVAGDGVHGAELWVSDGTNTRLVQDLNPYAHSADPEQLTAAGDRLYFTADDGIVGREVWSFPLAAGPGCQPTATRLCLNGGRFQVEAAWRDFQGNRGTGQAVALTADTGYFWFFSPSNVEAVLKVLDGRGLNNHFWVFYGALSSVEYYLTVTDTVTGAAKRFYNPPGQLASVGDTNGFGPLGAFSVKGLAPLTLVESRAVPAAGPCQPAPERLCLNGGRFAVEATWKDFQGKTGTGKAVDLTSDTGWFWFFDAANLEVMIKVLDGTALNGKHWVFYGALSNVEYTLTVTDTVTGKQNTYKNPSGRFGSVADTNAF